jgi:hypothetical protein
MATPDSDTARGAGAETRAAVSADVSTPVGRSGRSPPLDPGRFVVIRTPLLPFKRFDDWSAGLTAPAALADRGDLAAALEGDQDMLRHRLTELCRDEVVREAILVASPDLDFAIERWLEEPDDRNHRVAKSLSRYFSRMACRPTPFGLFAGCTLGRVAGETKVILRGRGESYRRVTRLDCGQLFEVVRELSSQDAARRTLSFRPNDSLVFRGARATFVEGRSVGGALSWHLVAVRNAPGLRAAVERASQGATLDQLGRHLSQVVEAKKEDIDAYLNELVDSQILLSSLDFSMTGIDPLSQVIDASKAAGCSQLTEALEGIRAQMSELDHTELRRNPSAYARIEATLKLVCSRVDASRLVQVDLFKASGQVTVGKSLADEIGSVVVGLASLPHPKSDRLRRFRESFRERYDRRVVPLLEALDEEYGIGFPEGDDLAVQSSIAARSPWDSFLVERYLETVRDARQELVLRTEELRPFMTRGGDGSLPTAMSALVTLAQCEPAGGPNEDGVFAHLRSLHGPSGATFLGRFCHLDPDLLQCVQEHLRSEERCQPDAVFAEIVHLPSGRVGNVLHRPILRDYEIPYLCKSGVEPEYQLPVKDLLVSVEGEAVRIWSARLGKEVVTRLTNAHNHFMTRNLPVYRFLAALQRQDVLAAASWTWGPIASSAFLPRVRWGHVILSLARWRLDGKQLASLVRAKPQERYSKVQELRSKLCLPRRVVAGDGDNQLVVDLDNVLMVETLVDLARRRRTLPVTEHWPAPECLPAVGPEGRFCCEVVVPFVRGGGVGSKLASHGVQLPSPCARTFGPGSEWLYARIYTGDALADRLLVDVVRPALSPVSWT